MQMHDLSNDVIADDLECTLKITASLEPFTKPISGKNTAYIFYEGSSIMLQRSKVKYGLLFLLHYNWRTVQDYLW